MLRERIRHHRDSPTSALLRAVDQLNKGIALIGHESVLMRKEMARLREAVEVATEQRSRERKYIRTGECLTVGEVSDLMAKEGSGGEEAEQPAKRVRAQTHCGRCSKIWP